MIFFRFPAGAGGAFHEHVAPVILVDVGAPEGSLELVCTVYWSLLAFPLILDVTQYYSTLE